MFFWGAVVYVDAYRAPDDATRIYGVGKQWMWKFQHPEGQREINDAARAAWAGPCKLLLTSEDVIHSFFVPAFRIHMDVLPDRYTIGLVPTPRKPGTYHLFCSQYCGTNHAGMIGTVVVMEPADYRALAAICTPKDRWRCKGRKIFLKYRCISCHSADENARRPCWRNSIGQAGRICATGRTVVADEDYLRESILNPAPRSSPAGRTSCRRSRGKSARRRSSP